jgi:hypothetical protein
MFMRAIGKMGYFAWFSDIDYERMDKGKQLKCYLGDKKMKRRNILKKGVERESH